jgi:hypothetical protein
VRIYFDAVSARSNWGRIGINEALTGSRVSTRLDQLDPSGALFTTLVTAFEQGVANGTFRPQQDPLLAFTVATIFSAMYPLFKVRLQPFLDARGLAREEQDRYVREELVQMLLYGIADPSIQR